MVLNKIKGRGIRVLLTLLLSMHFVHADVGKEEIGELKVDLYLGTNDASVDAGVRAKPAKPSDLKLLTKSKSFVFKHYFLLGSDKSALLRSYENWATPLKPSEAILVSFEPVGKAQGTKIKLDIDLWQSKKKIMKSATTTLVVGKPLYIKGPQWRGGYLIIAMELTSLKP